MNSDSFIAQNIGVKRSTFATVKKRMLQPPYSLIRPLHIPNFIILGAELLTITFIKLYPDKVAKLREIDASETLGHFPNIISLFGGSQKSIALLVSKSFTDFSLAQSAFASFYIEQEYLSPSDIYRCNIPLQSNGIKRFLEFAQYLSNHWKIPLNEESQLESVFPSNTTDFQRISPLGWKIFEGLLSHPESSIIELSKRLEKPRNTVSRWLRTFRKMNLYQTRFIPDLIRIGVNIQLNVMLDVQGLQREQLLEILKLIDNLFLPTDLFWYHSGIVFFAVFSGYESVRHTETQFFDEMNARHIPYRLQSKFIISTKNIDRRKSFEQSFAPLTSYLRNPTKYSLIPYNGE